jgi:hypothetical protein
LKIEHWKVFHWILIGVFVVQIVYGYYMVFFSGGPMLPLFRRVDDLAPEAITLRRLYSIETWLAILGLALYLAISEVLPHRLRDMWHHEVHPGLRTDMTEIEDSEGAHDDADV